MEHEKKQNSRFKKILWVSVVIALVLIGQRVYFRTTDDFRFANITCNLPYHPEWDNPPLSSEETLQLDSILNQKFRYIGKGAQAYAFESEDGQYVLKFFKFKHLRVSWREYIIPPISFLKEIKERRIARKHRLVNSVFNGHKLAYDVHKEGTGMIYLHLNPTTHLNKSVTLYDKLGLKRVMPLDPTIFIVQKKCKTTRAVINELIAAGKLDLVKDRIKSLLDFHVSEYKKGIYDRDHGVKHNTGFVGDQPIRLDVGKLTRDEKMKLQDNYALDLIKIAHKLDTWLKEQHLNEYNELASYIENYISTCLSQPFTLSK